MLRPYDLRRRTKRNGAERNENTVDNLYPGYEPDGSLLILLVTPKLRIDMAFMPLLRHGSGGGNMQPPPNA